jgi:hypothetical protein
MEFTDEMLKHLVVPGKRLPVYLDERSPQVEAPSRNFDDHHWQPACTTTSKLTRCLDAVRDAATALAPVAACGPAGGG